MYYNRLPLEASFNTREHGGYATANKGITNWKTFLRSDDVSLLTPEDIEFLIQYGLTTVIDLRSMEERERTDYVLAAEAAIQTIHLPLGSENGAQPSIAVTDPSKQLGSFYIACLENSQSTIKQMIEIMAENEGITLFHCMAGKDRTGVVSALLLDFAQVSKADILAHYEITHGHISQNPLISQAQLGHQGFPIELLYSKADYMATMLDHLAENYGNAETYFKQIGLDENTLAKLKEKIVG
ncbi:tyrosine-protein phosphatase [Enterococcus sp.]|uniref:tyrosine-protein phosphatase n=1 Tax=Enterococcus sp. TaxID=35783 RepID=UPI002FCC6242